jgi:peptidyl-prolyl cis-trans isomerase SurA
VTLARLVIPLAADASETDVAAAQVEAERVAAALRSCADVDARKKDYGPGSGTAAPAPLRSLPDAEREAVTSLAPGKASPPVRTRDGMAVLVVCARTGPATPGSLEQIRNRIVNERMVSYATGYLQELRRDAVIEYR